MEFDEKELKDKVLKLMLENEALKDENDTLTGRVDTLEDDIMNYREIIRSYEFHALIAKRYAERYKGHITGYTPIEDEA